MDKIKIEVHHILHILIVSLFIPVCCMDQRRGAVIVQRRRERQNYNNTPLMQAALCGNYNSVQSLSKKCPQNINIKNSRGQTALMLAAINGYRDTVQFLLEWGAQIDAKTHDGKTALMLAAINGHINTVQLLLEWGVNIDTKTYDGMTALMLAAINGHTNTVKFLLEWGVQIDAKTHDGMTALMAAAINGHIALMHLLLQSNAKPNIYDNIKMRTALNWLLRMREGAKKKKGKQLAPEIVQEGMNLLLSYKADIGVMDKKGKTVLNWVEKNNWKKEERILKDYLHNSHNQAPLENEWQVVSRKKR